MAGKAAAAKAHVTKAYVREYETIYILRPTVDAKRAEKVSDRVTDVIAKEKGKLVKVDTWGRRTLAYPINKFLRGVFVYVKYVGPNTLVAELERNLRLLDDVMRFQTVLNRDMVDLDTVAVDAEQIKFSPVEEETEVESDDPEVRLGIARAPRHSVVEEIIPEPAAVPVEGAEADAGKEKE